MTTIDFQKLAQDARPTSDADWGSSRQIDAENRFFRAVQAFGIRIDSLDCAKATTDEMIDEAMKRVNRKLRRLAR